MFKILFSHVRDKSLAIFKVRVPAEQRAVSLRRKQIKLHQIHFTFNGIFFLSHKMRTRMFFSTNFHIFYFLSFLVKTKKISILFQTKFH